MSALIGILISVVMFFMFIVKVSFYIVVITLQYGIPAYIVYKLFRFFTRPFRYSAL